MVEEIPHMEEEDLHYLFWSLKLNLIIEVIEQQVYELFIAREARRGALSPTSGVEVKSRKGSRELKRQEQGSKGEKSISG